MDQYFFFIQSHIHSGQGDEIIEEESFKSFDTTDIGALALETLMEVPRTWKNAHSIVVTAVKVLEDMWEGIEKFELHHLGEKFTEVCKDRPDWKMRGEVTWWD